MTAKTKIIIGAALLLLVATILLILLWSGSFLDKISYSDNPIPKQDSDNLSEGVRASADSCGIALPVSEMPDSESVVNLLLLGTDYRVPNTDDPGRADCTMICSINKDTGTIHLISIERGITVPIPAQYGLTSDLMTHAYHWGGGELSQAVVSTCFNINLLGYLQVDFESFASVVDAIGGVDLLMSDLETNALDISDYQNIETDSDYHRLCHLNGDLALRYCRLRSIDSDWNRVDRQKKCIAAAAGKIRDLSPDELVTLANIVLPLINTNISKTDLASLLLSLPSVVSSGDIQMSTTPEASSIIHCDFVQESDKLSQLLYSDNSNSSASFLRTISDALQSFTAAVKSSVRWFVDKLSSRLFATPPVITH